MRSANVLAQALLAGDADAGGHFLKMMVATVGETRGPTAWCVADARARNGARGNCVGREARGHESTRPTFLSFSMTCSWRSFSGFGFARPSWRAVRAQNRIM